MSGVPAAPNVMLRKRNAIRVAALCISLACVALLSAASTAGASGGLLVTFAARVCPEYTDITANRARNDIQESLRDLGADTPYSPGQAMDPAVEQAHQPNCAPLPGWTFTMGTGYKTRAVSGPWGSLSIVTSPYPTTITTKPSTPLLDNRGLGTGKTIDGATTIELTPAQAERAARPNSLWAQGGTTTDPVLNIPYPGQYGFGALRCAIDDINGDNVEWIGYPSGTRHVFCFAYYVKPPPTSGTIVIRKQITAPAGTSESFPFEGNVTFNGSGQFLLGIPAGQTSAQETFIRAETTPGSPPWEATEVVPPNWRLSGLSCSSKTGASISQTNIAAAHVAITLASADTVTCTYTDQFIPPPGGLLLRKVTNGGTGEFDFAVTPAGGGNPTLTSALTKEEGLAVDAMPGPLSLQQGTYEIAETSPHSKRGHWKLDAVECGGHQLQPVSPVSVSVQSGAGTTCTFTNGFTPRGALAITKTTTGAVATTGFVITPDFGAAEELHKTATTVKEGVPARAHGSSTSDLPLGRYLVQETGPTPTHGGHWALIGVRCRGQYVPFANGQAEVTLSEEHPAAVCAFTNAFKSSPPPEPPPGAESTELSIAKRALRDRIPLGSPVSYEVLVRNHGPGTAQDVVVEDQSGGTATLVRATTSQGTCTHRLPLSCQLGTLHPGALVKILVTVIPHRTGRLVNHVVLGTSTPDASYQSDRASATITVTGASSETGAEHVPSFTG